VNGLVMVALIVFSLWLGVLTLVVILTVRQIALLTVRLSTAAGGQLSTITDDEFLVDDDGPEVGGELPEEVASALPELGWQKSFILLVSSTCAPCRELAAELQAHHFAAPVIALVAGRDRELADDLAELLPSGMHIVRDPQATELAGALQIHSTPFAVAIGSGRVVEKTYVHRSADLVAFIEGEGSPDVVKIARNPKEVDRVG
jgi:hypothetical protein